MFGTLVLLLPELFTSNAPLCVIMSLAHTAQRRQFFFFLSEKKFTLIGILWLQRLHQFFSANYKFVSLPQGQRPLEEALKSTFKTR